MAHRLYKRGKIWWCWGILNGERWAESTRCVDREAAKSVQRDIERRRATHDPAAQALGLEAAINEAIAHRERLGRSPHTLKFWKQTGGHLCRVLGHDTDVHTIDLVTLERYYDTRRAEADAHPHTIACEYKTLRSALHHAAKRGLYRGNIDAIWPADLVRDAYTPRDRWLTPSEYQQLWLALPPERRDYLTAYVYTGARRRELQTITADGVRLDRMEVHLRGTKTRRADRWVPIHPVLRPILEARMHRAPPFDEWAGVNDAMHDYAAKIGIPHVCCTDLRRTFASWLAQAGVPMLTTARLMGHASTQMVERVYAQLAPSTLADAVARLPTVAPVSQTAGTGDGWADGMDAKIVAFPAKNAESRGLQ